ncbi:MAG: hypothetical protein JJE07_05125 [Flavobacteriaceae bacterium]|nr:hypothetical protein [Flavobacteriaceae bacterium]HZJ36739.1 asparagine synthase-related protein [Gillisia sp.]
MKRLSEADCLRADEFTIAHGIEARVPFLDKTFLQTAMEIDPKYKMPGTYGEVEKYILKSFWHPGRPVFVNKSYYYGGIFPEY